MRILIRKHVRIRAVNLDSDVPARVLHIGVAADRDADAALKTIRTPYTDLSLFINRPKISTPHDQQEENHYDLPDSERAQPRPHHDAHIISTQ